MLHKSNKRVGVTLLLVPFLLLLVTSVSAQPCPPNCYKLDQTYRIIELGKPINLDSHPTTVENLPNASGGPGWYVVSPDSRINKSSDDEYGLDSTKTLPELGKKKNLIKNLRQLTCPPRCPNYINGVTRAAVKIGIPVGKPGYTVIFKGTINNYTVDLKKHAAGTPPTKTRKISLIEVR